MRHLPSFSGRRSRAAATIATLFLLVLAGCGEDDSGTLFTPMGADGGDASLDHADAKSSDTGSSKSDVSATDHVEPGEAAGDTAEDTSTPSDTGTPAPDATGSDALDSPAPVDANDAGVTADATDSTPAADVTDATDAGTGNDDVSVTDATDAGSDAVDESDATDAGCADSDPCTVDSQLADGSCAHVAIVCTASDQCHSAGTCNPTDGVCSNPPLNDTACSDGDACTQNDKCVTGVCTGTPIVCTALDTCHTAGTCTAGICSNPPLNDTACSDGDACTQNDKCVTGVCTGTPIVCTALDTCHTAGTCSGGVCSNPTLNDTPCNDGDACTLTDKCVTGVCTGTNPIVCPDPDQCHDTRVCNPANGTCSNPAKGEGTPCSDGSVCTQTDTCQSGICTGANPVTCTALDQCHLPGTCDPSSGCSNPPKNNDDPCNDGNVCTQTDTCQSGACVGANPVTCTASDECHEVKTCDAVRGCAVDDGRICTTAAGGRCNIGACVPTFMVVRVGDGSAALTNLATAVFVERHYLDGLGATIETIPMPTAVNGSNQPLTMSGSAASEGALTLSVDNLYVTLAGYAATPGTAGPGGPPPTSISSSTSVLVNRIVGRISADGTVDTTTHISDGFSANNVRGATSTNGTDIWVTGAGGTTGGLRYVTLGSAGASTQLISAGTNPNTVRVPQIFGNELYATGSNSGFANVFKVGSGTPPKTNGQTPVVLPGMPASGLAPYSFALFDTDGNGSADMLYLADERAPNVGGGVQKWLLLPQTVDGSVLNLWTLSATFNASGVRGLAVLKIGSNYHIVATSADVAAANAANKILYFIDDGTPNPTPVVLGTSAGGATASSIFRGVAIAP